MTRPFQSSKGVVNSFEYLLPMGRPPGYFRRSYVPDRAVAEENVRAVRGEPTDLRQWQLRIEWDVLRLGQGNIALGFDGQNRVRGAVCDVTFRGFVSIAQHGLRTGNLVF